MKTGAVVLFIVIATIACGCAGTVQEDRPQPAASGSATAAGIPDLTGTWTGPMQGYDQGTGFSDYPDFTVKMNVTEQKGRVFAGEILMTSNGTVSASGFAGAIGRDGKTLTITEEDGGYCTGVIVGGNEVELIYVQDGSPYSVAIDTFYRV
jgi:hypothetical protein